MNFLFCLLCLLIFPFRNSQAAPFSDSAIGAFDISPDGQKVIFIGYKNETTSICEVNIRGGLADVLIEGEVGIVYSNPKYSRSGDQVLYVMYNGVHDASTLCLFSLKDRKKRDISDGKKLITEGSFGVKDNLIFFLQANTIKPSSPIGVVYPRGFNIFSLDLKSNNVQKITNKDAYIIDCLSVMDSMDLLFHEVAGDEGGVFILSNRRAKRVFPKNSYKRSKQALYSPSYDSVSRKLAFTMGGYELHQMSLPDRTSQMLYRSPGGQIASVKQYDSGKRILFRQKDAPSRIFSIEVATGLVNEILVQF